MVNNEFPKCNQCNVWNCKRWVSKCKNFLPLEPMQTSLLELAFHTNPDSVVSTLAGFGISVKNAHQRPWFKLVY